MPGWNQPGFDASSWQSVRSVNYALENLVATISPPVRRKERFVPATIVTTPAGETVVDMGQNFAGVVQLKVSGPKGATIRLQHGETLDKEGNFTMQNLALGPLPPPPQQDWYTLKGEGEEVYIPHFTTHGFRYVKVEGFPGTQRLTTSPASPSRPICQKRGPLPALIPSSTSYSTIFSGARRAILWRFPRIARPASGWGGRAILRSTHALALS